jgi:predicted DNA-binding ribbon-helix-helix protein
MSKSEVYSWRVEPATKRCLEDEARRRKLTLAQLLDRITQDWLSQRAADDSEPERIRAAARRWIGSISGGGERRSERVRELVRERLRGKRASNRPR